MRQPTEPVPPREVLLVAVDGRLVRRHVDRKVVHEERGGLGRLRLRPETTRLSAGSGPQSAGGPGRRREQGGRVRRIDARQELGASEVQDRRAPARVPRR